MIARAATLVPIVIGLVEAFGRPLRSQVGKAMLLLAGILPSVTGVGVLTRRCAESGACELPDRCR